MWRIVWRTTTPNDLTLCSFEAMEDVGLKLLLQAGSRRPRSRHHEVLKTTSYHWA